MRPATANSGCSASSVSAGDGRSLGVVAREEVGDVREGDVLVGRGEAVGVDALGGGEAEALADGGDLAQLFLALRETVFARSRFQTGSMRRLALLSDV